MARLHLVALPHTQVSPAFCGCAYTAKVLKFCKMLGADYEISLYAPEGPEVPGATLISCLSNQARLELFGHDDPARLPAWPTNEQAAIFNHGVIDQLRRRSQPQDLVLLVGGLTHKPIADALPDRLFVEPFVGYEGIFSNFCAFESYAWMHTVYAQKGIKDLRWFDAVVPPYFDPAEFPILNNGRSESLLFLGRCIERKGLHIAVEIAKTAGRKLIVAGAGGRMSQGIFSWDGERRAQGDIEYVGPVNAAERAELLAGAKAVLMPTIYVEPGGNVALEAMAAGTPVIAPDAGVFTETVAEGISGFRFRTLRGAVDAVDAACYLSPERIASYANTNYSLDATRPKFIEWFRQLGTLREKGWYQL